MREVVWIALKQLWGHKRRLAGMFLAVFLGTAFLSGTLMLGDTLKANFDALFANANAGTDVVVRSSTSIEASAGRQTLRARGSIDATLLDRIRAVDGVAAAGPEVSGYGQLIGSDGEAVGGNGPPRIAGNWIADPDLNAYRLVSGRAPQADDEVVINRGAAREGGLSIGDTTTVETPRPVPVRIVGIATFGTDDGLGRSTFTAFTLGAAERYLMGDRGTLSSILVKADTGVTQTRLASRIREVLPQGVQALTGERFVQQTIDDISGQFVDLFRVFLVVFAGVALLVAAFSIHNTFSILVAQRARESALLRMLGAARRQVLAAAVVEALLVGVTASAAGVLGGAGFAGLLKGLFDTFGFALPAGGLVVTGGTVTLALGTGLAVTLVASVSPAVRGSRVLPLAALRDVAVDRSSVSRSRAIAGVGLTVLGATALITAVLGAGSVGRAGIGAVLTVVGVVVLGPVLAEPVGSAIGWPLARMRRVVGSLARRNAVRNPRRTAGTAAALMVGVAVVTLFTVFIASLEASIRRSAEDSFGGDLAVTAPSFGGGGLDPQLAKDVAALPEVRTAAGVGSGAVRVDGRSTLVTVADSAALSDVLDLDVVDGSLRSLGADGLAVSSSLAGERGWSVGSPTQVGFIDGAGGSFTIRAIYDATDVVGDVLMPSVAWAPHAEQRRQSAVFVVLRDGVAAREGKAAVEAVAGGYGEADVQDRDGYVDSVTAGPKLLLGLVYVMLGLAIVIALFGIANTLALSVHERTRELGLLRAVGASRAQVRSIVRWESVIVAVFGTLTGLVVGAFLGWALVSSASATIAVFDAPPTRLLVILLVGAVAGLLAGVRPARRAARVNVIQAISTE